MKQEFVLLVGLLCALSTSVDAFTYSLPGPLSVNGIYNGRFGIEKNVQAVFDMGGVSGYVQFFQKAPGQPVEINVNLDGLDQFRDPYPWRIHNYPVRYALLDDYPCGSGLVGGVFDPDDDPVTGIDGDLFSRLGGIRYDRPVQTFMDDNITLCGSNSIIGRTLRIDRGNNEWICANIQYHGARVERLRAAFDFGPNSTLQGDIIITKVIGRDDATVEVDLHMPGVEIIDQPPPFPSEGHIWSIHFGSCDSLSDRIFGEDTRIDPHVLLDPFANCGRDRQRECPIGDFTRKCGPLTFNEVDTFPLPGRVGGRSRAFCTDNQLGSIPCSYLFDKKNPDQITSIVVRSRDGGMPILGCARIGPPVQPQFARCTFQSSLIALHVIFFQSSPKDKTHFRVHLAGIKRRDVKLVIREDSTPDTYNCTNLGPVISRPGSFGSPLFARPLRVPLDGPQTSDFGLLGSLCEIIDIPPDSQRINTKANTANLPLFGQCSIIDRSLVVEEVGGGPLACCTIKQEREYPITEIASLLGYQNMESPPVGK